jgi:glycosyltransferase involved in cell wall biosynthesis
MVNILHRLAAWVYKCAPRILVVSSAAADYLRRRGVDPGKISVAHHWLDTDVFEQHSLRNVRSEFGWDGKFVVMFAGNIGMVQGLETVIETAALLADRNVEFVFVGDGSDRAHLEDLVSRNGLTNVRFVGKHPQAEMPAFMRAADALLVHLRRSEIADYAIPTKVLSYLAAGVRSFAPLVGRPPS